MFLSLFFEALPYLTGCSHFKHILYLDQKSEIKEGLKTQTFLSKASDFRYPEDKQLTIKACGQVLSKLVSFSHESTPLLPLT